MLRKYYVIRKKGIFVSDRDLLIMKVFYTFFSFCFLLLSVGMYGQTSPSSRHVELSSLTFSISPNPMTAGILHLQTETTQLKEIVILNLLGEKVYVTHTYENTLDLQQLTKGIYFIQLKQGEKKGIKRLVVP